MSARWKSSYVDGSDDDVIIWDWLQTDEAWQGISQTKFCCFAVLYVEILSQ